MVRSARSATLVSTLGLLALCGASSSAMAAGFALREQSAEGLGNAYAGQTAKAYNVSTVYYNPAGMSRLDETEVAGTTTWIAPVAKFSGQNSNPLGGTISGSQPENAIKPAAIGSIFAATKLNDDWHLGLSVAAPYGMRSEYKEDWVGRYQALASDVTDIDTSIALSYKINDKLSIGGGPRLSYMKARLSQAINTRAIGMGIAQRLAGAGQLAQASAMQSLANTWGDGLGKVEGDDYAFGYNLGLLYQFDKGTRVGVDYRSRVFHKLDGDATYQVPASTGSVAALASQFANRSATAKFTLPDSLNIGVYHEINDKWAVMSDVQWTHWSVFQHLGVVDANGQTVSDTPEKWNDTIFISVGANYKVNPALTLHGGLAFDQSAVKEENLTARIPDTNRYWTSIGASYDVTPDIGLHVGYTHLFADKVNINNTANANAGTGTLTGSYDSHADIVSASFAMKF